MFPLLRVIAAVYMAMSIKGPTSTWFNMPEFFIPSAVIIEDVEPAAVEAPKYLFVGNSLVTGLKAYGDEEHTYVCKVGISLPALIKDYSDDIKAADFNIALIQMGSNELGGWKKENFKDRYTELIAVIQNASPGCRVICMSIVPVTTARDTGGTRFNNANVATYTEWIKEVVEETGTEFLDLSPFFGTVLRTDWAGNDGMHLKGTIYKNWYEYIMSEMS